MRCPGSPTTCNSQAVYTNGAWTMFKYTTNWHITSTGSFEDNGCATTTANAYSQGACSTSPDGALCRGNWLQFISGEFIPQPDFLVAAASIAPPPPPTPICDTGYQCREGWEVCASAGTSCCRAEYPVACMTEAMPSSENRCCGGQYPICRGTAGGQLPCSRSAASRIPSSAVALHNKHWLVI